MKTSGKLKVGFIGLGDQGAPMARAIAENFDLYVWARRPQAFETLAGVPFQIANDLKNLAEVTDIVCLCLNDDKDIHEILSKGLKDGLSKGKILVNHGTGEPDENKHLAEDLAKSGIYFLDAPVSGGRPAAEGRTLTTMVGGDIEAFQISKDVFNTFSANVFHLGGAGTGQMAKLLNNAMTMTNLKNAVDVFLLAEKSGLDTKLLYQVISSGSGSSMVLKSIGKDSFREIAPHIQTLMKKDIHHFYDAVQSTGPDAKTIYERGLSGAEGLLNLVKAIS